MICLFVLISFQLIIRIYIFLTLIQAFPPPHILDEMVYAFKFSYTCYPVIDYS